VLHKQLHESEKCWDGCELVSTDGDCSCEPVSTDARWWLNLWASVNSIISLTAVRRRTTIFGIMRIRVTITCANDRDSTCAVIVGQWTTDFNYVACIGLGNLRQPLLLLSFWVNKLVNLVVRLNYTHVCAYTVHVWLLWKVGLIGDAKKENPQQGFIWEEEGWGLESPWKVPKQYYVC